jgi:biotin synthase
MTLRQLPLHAEGGLASLGRASPEYVRISTASAIALRLRSGRFARDFTFGGINVLLSYEDGCRSACAYCGLARSRSGSYEDKSFIRVGWPLVATDALVERLARYEAGLTRVCVSMVTHPRAYHDTCEITGAISERISTPVSVLVAPPTLKKDRLETLHALGVDMIGVGLDAVTEEVFRRTRNAVAGAGLRWEKYWQVLDDAREIFGPWKVNAHVVVGLGESDRELLSMVSRLTDRQVSSYLFCFNPEPGTPMAGTPRPTLRRWRRLQLARHLVEAEGYELDQFAFAPDGELVLVSAGERPLDEVVADGQVFMTNGCPGEAGAPGCTRPYGSYGPREEFRDYPFLPAEDDLYEIHRQLGLGEIVGEADGEADGEVN